MNAQLLGADSSDFDGLGFDEINLLSIVQIPQIGSLSPGEAVKILARAKAALKEEE